MRTKMTETEYKEQKERLSRYEKARDRIAVIAKVRALINNGILSINCACDKHVDFDYLGEEFKERLVNHITSFLDNEIENAKQSMEDV